MAATCCVQKERLHSSRWPQVSAVTGNGEGREMHHLFSFSCLWVISCLLFVGDLCETPKAVRQALPPVVSASAMGPWNSLSPGLPGQASSSLDPSWQVFHCVFALSAYVRSASNAPEGSTTTDPPQLYPEIVLSLLFKNINFSPRKSDHPVTIPPSCNPHLTFKHRASADIVISYGCQYF